MIPEMKNTIEEMTSRIGDTEEHMSDLEDRTMKTTQSSKKKANL